MASALEDLFAAILTALADGAVPDLDLASLRAATAAAGGSLSHHHGIGRVRRDWMDTELGTSGVTLLQTLKAALDPAGVMNPGVLVPDRPGGEAR